MSLRGKLGRSKVEKSVHLAEDEDCRRRYSWHDIGWKRSDPGK